MLAHLNPLECELHEGGCFLCVCVFVLVTVLVPVFRKVLGTQ